MSTGQLDRLWDELHYLSREPVEVLYNTRQFIGFQPADRIENTNKFAELIPSLQERATAFDQSVPAAEPRQLSAVIELAARAWRRPLSTIETDELTGVVSTPAPQTGPPARCRDPYRHHASPGFTPFPVPHRTPSPWRTGGDAIRLGTGEPSELLSLVLDAR